MSSRGLEVFSGFRSEVWSVMELRPAPVLYPPAHSYFTRISQSCAAHIYPRPSASRVPHAYLKVTQKNILDPQKMALARSL